MHARTSNFADFRYARAIPADPVERLETLARFLDGAFRVPGTNIRVGADALLGLVPGVGNLLSTAISAYLIWEARHLGLSRLALARMAGNVALDSAIGAIPVAGNVFDVFWRSNQRNMKIIREHLHRTGKIIDAEYTRVD